MIRQRKPLVRKTRIRRSQKPMQKRGKTKEKKEKRYNDYISSPVWKQKRKEALERAGHQCEWETLQATLVSVRCPETTGLHVHHKTNARFGGDELPEDLMVLCGPHHDFVERRDFPHRQSHKRRTQRCK